MTTHLKPEEDQPVEHEVCLFIDDPNHETVTTWIIVNPLQELPQHMRPIGLDTSNHPQLLAADICMEPEAAERVLKQVKNCWEAFNDALYTQYVGKGTETGMILGYTIQTLGAPGQFARFRIYTARSIE